ncbi:hypothetical protein [Nostoc sp. DSM 114161]|uniref:hypothetical protein n=1 Tax=Nostoc sp. DSM 114161 TaxID=3440143 RepID=UPI004045E761
MGRIIEKALGFKRDRPGVGQVLKIDNPKSVPESTSSFSFLALVATVSVTFLCQGKPKMP